MLKAFGKLWLRGAKRLAKAQQSQQKKLQKQLVKAVAGTSLKKARKTIKRVSGLTGVPLQGDAGTRKRRTITVKKVRLAKAVIGSSNVPLTAGGSWTRSYLSSLEVDARLTPRRMNSWLFVPDAAGALATAASAMPLVVMLHGCDQSAADFAHGTRMNLLAVRYGFAVLYPEQSLRAHAQRCWPWYQTGFQRGGNEVAMVAGMIEKAIAQHGFDPSRVYVAGLSAGAAMAQTLALRRPDLIAAVASHSGPVFGAADSRMRALSIMQHGASDPLLPILALQRDYPDFPGMPALIVQGAHDSLVRPVNARQLVEQFRLLNRLPSGAPGPVLERAARGKNDAFRIDDYRQGRRVLVRLCEVAHLGHAWSGGDATLRYNSAKGPDASALLWDFFKRHRRLGHHAHTPSGTPP